MSWAASKAVGPRDPQLAVERMEASKRVQPAVNGQFDIG